MILMKGRLWKYSYHQSEDSYQCFHHYRSIRLLFKKLRTDIVVRGDKPKWEATKIAKEGVDNFFKNEYRCIKFLIKNRKYIKNYI